MIYKSKKVWWSASLFIVPTLAGMIAGVVWICTGIGRLVDHAAEPARGSLTLVAAGLIAFAVCSILLSSFLSASYEITQDELVVRFGLIRPRYPLASIGKAVPTRVPLGPAWSFATSWDMVYIGFRKHGLPLAISPANKTEFLRELAERVPGLDGRGES